MSPTQRTLAWLREGGFEAGVVERHSTFSNKKHDLYGFIDIVAIDDGTTIGVQATSGSNVSKRVQKIVELPTARKWLACGNRKVWVVGWKKYAKAIERKHWRPKLVEVLLEDVTA